MAENCVHTNLVGSMIYEGFSKTPNLVVQIDAATGKSETADSVLRRSATISQCLKTLGLVPGDVMALGGRNHLDLRIPFFAAIFNGLPVASVDPSFKYDEIKAFLEISRPKIAFIQLESFDDMSKAAKALDLDLKLVTFEDGEYGMRKLIEECGDSAESFQLAQFDGEQVPVFLISTSGTSGMPKLATIHHGNACRVAQLFIKMFSPFINGCASPHPLVNLNLSPVQWISGCFYSFIMPLMGVTNVQTSGPSTPENFAAMINEYKPFFSMVSPATAASFLTEACDLTSFQFLLLTGSKVYPDLMQELRSRVGGQVIEGYGQTETLGMALRGAPDGPPGNCGQYMPSVNTIRLVNPETEEEITEPHVPGEMYVKSHGFSGYYNMPEETKEAFTEDGFYKTGDIMYRDENHYFFFVEKTKTLIKYNGYSIYPTEIEAVLRAHPAVSDAAVVGVAARRGGEAPAACVVRRPHCAVGADDLQDLVAEKLSDSKRLRGGVVFLAALPYTSTGKVARGKLRDLARAALHL